MRALNDKIDRFCLTHPRFGIPRLMLFIVIGNILVYVFAMMDTTNSLLQMLVFNPALFCRGQVWRIVTFALIPPSGYGLLGVALALYFYYFIGSSLEQAWGAGKFTIYYFSSLLLTAVYSLALYGISGGKIILSVGTMYVNLSLFFAFATLWPEQRVLLFFILPIKMKWLAWFDAAVFAFGFITSLLAGNIAGAFVPVVAMLGYLVFCGEWLFEKLSPGRLRRERKRKARTIQFREAAQKVRRQEARQGYTRKCAVCGRTDTDYPGLEFRFCSRCAGYHCFCEDHINNHVHFTE